MEKERENPPPRKGPGAIKRLRSFFTAAALAATGLGPMVGCGTPPVPTPQGKVEMQDQEQRKNQAFLDGILQRISGGLQKELDNGDIIIHSGGGKYFLVGASDRNTLQTIAGTHRLRIERWQTSKGMGAFVLNGKNAAAMSVTAYIMEKGQLLREDQLPDDVRILERARQEVVQQMKEEGIIE